MEWVTHIVVFVLGAWFGIGIMCLVNVGKDK